MATFGFKKSVDDIKPAVLLPEDWYTVEILEDPTLQDNAKKRDGASQEDGAGENLVIAVAVQDDTPEYSGRRFTIYLPWPNDLDEEVYTGGGQLKADAKMARIAKAVESFGGSVDGEQFVLSVGMAAKVYVVQEMDNRNEGEIRNSLDVFRSGFRSAKPIETTPY